MTYAELAILSIIAEAPITGFGVQDVIDKRNVRLWTLIGVQSIFYVIEKLESQGLVTNIDEKPPHDTELRLYRITSAGIGVLQTAITDLLASPRKMPGGFDIGLANLPVLKTSQVKHALMGYRASLQSRYDALTEQRDHLQAADAPFHILSMFEHQIVLLDAELAWFDDWFERWQDQAPPDDTEVETRPPTEAPRMQQVIIPQAPDSFHKLPTRSLTEPEDEDIEFPPPPQKRTVDPKAKTRHSQPTPPSNELDS